LNFFFETENVAFQIFTRRARQSNDFLSREKVKKERLMMIGHCRRHSDTPAMPRYEMTQSETIVGSSLKHPIFGAFLGTT
jgi:hypothetical protein